MEDELAGVDAENDGRKDEKAKSLIKSHSEVTWRSPHHYLQSLHCTRSFSSVLRIRSLELGPLKNIPACPRRKTRKRKTPSGAREGEGGRVVQKGKARFARAAAA